MPPAAAVVIGPAATRFTRVPSALGTRTARALGDRAGAPIANSLLERLAEHVEHR